MMKRSTSESDLEQFVRDWETTSMTAFSTSDAAKPLALPSPLPLPDPNNYYSPAHLYDSRDDQEVMNDISSHNREAAETNVLLLSQNLTPKGSTLDSPKLSSICGNNPKSKENKVRGTTSVSSDHDQTDDEEDVETDAGQCEQSLNPFNLKRFRRMLSNRESARRSRKRKQEHLAGLQFQAEQLRVQNDSLCEQLTNAHQQFRDAEINNRVLKSDVEALRAKVKLAEDMLARGSLTCGLNLLLQSHLTSPQPIATHNIGWVANVSPTTNIHGDDSIYSGLTVSGNSALELANVDISNGNLNNGISGDAVSGVSEIWP
ncbi:basic leucine zipper 9-like isoform X2 [Durio zibethinus]|uniref:Basic leucine zipper 9-like isoform X2 n=1 Tax=Durio zibethinus TaxID=66656 RepID=A0A6P5ZPE3_DURZI|nr:basic leucine zipper 9-like isoform X2 [Durio zibethinus]